MEHLNEINKVKWEKILFSGEVSAQHTSADTDGNTKKSEFLDKDTSSKLDNESSINSTEAQNKKN